MRILFILTLTLSTVTLAAPLTNQALFHRCFAHLTQSRPALNSNIVNEVKNGKNAIDACVDMLNSTRLINQRLSSPTDTQQLIFENMHEIHYSWFKFRDVQSEQSQSHRNALGDQYDLSTSALYFTKALFDGGFQLSKAVTEDAILSPIRTEMNPVVGGRTGLDKSRYYWADDTPFAPTGKLLGIRELQKVTLPHPNGDYVLGESWGAGFIGTPIYIIGSGSRDQFNTPETKKFKSNGGLVVKRDFGEAFFHDALCVDELPALRKSDVQGLYNANAKVAFRTAAACTSCHASIDQVAGVIRNLKFHIPYTRGKSTGVSMIKWPTTNQNKDYDWPMDGDRDYGHKVPTGSLMYRNHAGVLRNVKVDSLSQLGQVLSQEDDFYICVAKRYYKYFVGIDAYIGDPERSDKSKEVASPHRARVIEMGKRLKAHQNPKRTIEEILRVKEYGESNYGLKGGEDE